MDGFAAGAAWPGAVAVSGGGDSLALMHLLARWAKKAKLTPPVVLTVDHGLRPDSRKETAAVAKKARALGLDVSVLRWPGPHPRSGIEAAARQARYALMGKWAKRRKIATLYVGHNQDEQAETFLLRLARGSGIDGLAAMRPLSPYPHADFPMLAVARPLLSFGRAELRAWLSARGEAWVEDPMNDDPRFDRIKFRRLGPALADAGLTAPRIALAASHMAAARDLLEELTQALLVRIARPVSGGMLVDGALLAAAPRELGLRALAALLRSVSGAAYRPRFESLERLFDRLASQGLGGGMTLSGCRIGSAPAAGRDFGPQTLKITREKPRKSPI